MKTSAGKHRYILQATPNAVTKSVADPSDEFAIAALGREQHVYRRLQNIVNTSESSERFRHVQMLDVTMTSITMENAGVSLKRLSQQICNEDKRQLGIRVPLRAVEVISICAALLIQKNSLAACGVFDIDGHSDNHCLAPVDLEAGISALDLGSIVEIDREHTLLPEDSNIVPNLSVRDNKRPWIAPEIQALIDHSLAKASTSQERFVEVEDNPLHSYLYGNETKNRAIDHALQFQVGYLMGFLLPKCYEPTCDGIDEFREFVQILHSQRTTDRFINICAALTRLQEICDQYQLELPEQTTLRFKTHQDLGPKNFNPQTDFDNDNPFFDEFGNKKSPGENGSTFGEGGRSEEESEETAFANYETETDEAYGNSWRGQTKHEAAMPAHVPSPRKKYIPHAIAIVVFCMTFLSTWHDVSTIKPSQLAEELQWRDLYKIELALNSSADQQERNTLLAELIVMRVKAPEKMLASIEKVFNDNYFKCQQALAYDNLSRRSNSANRECMNTLAKAGVTAAKQWL